MICILFILILLSMILFCYREREGLDNCKDPPIRGSTAGEIKNSNQISTLQNQINNLDGALRQQVATNTGTINNLTSNLKDLGDLRQIVAGLAVTVKNTNTAIQQLKQQMSKVQQDMQNQTT